MRVSPHGTPVQDGNQNPQQLTFNLTSEERGPTWSRDGHHVAYACRFTTFKICVMNMDADHPPELPPLTAGISQLTPTWSGDGTQLVFHGNADPDPNQLFRVTLSFGQNGAISAGEPVP
jgi:Tol biopolymer transport system component